MQIIGLILTGLFAGYISGLLGIGGGVVFVPALSLLLGLSFQKAVGISLAVIIPTALSGVIKHYIEGNVDIKLVFIIALFAIIGAWFGATSTSFLPVSTLKKIFAIFLIFVGFNMLFGWTNNFAKKQSNETTQIKES